MPEKHCIVEALLGRLATIEDRVRYLECLSQAEPHKLLNPLHEWILEVGKAHGQLGQRLVKSESILVVKLTMIVDAD